MGSQVCCVREGGGVSHYRVCSMSGGSKLARKMALKKKLEEEYRLAAERMRVAKVSKFSGYRIREESVREESKVDINKKKQIYIQEEIAETEESISSQTSDPNAEENRLREIEQLRLKELERKMIEEDIAAQARRDAEVAEKRRIEDERIRLEAEEKKKIADKIRKERAKKLEEEKKMIEMKEIEEIRQLKKEEESRTEDKKISTEEEQSLKALEKKELEEIQKTEERIRQLEHSIATLDVELERFDIERMKDKTKKVMKRMSLVISETTDVELDNILQRTTVNGFMENEIMWGKYLGKEIETQLC